MSVWVDGIDVSWTDGQWDTEHQPPHVETPDQLPEGQACDMSFDKEITLPQGTRKFLYKVDGGRRVCCRWYPAGQ